jgi:hypothetical protein
VLAPIPLSRLGTPFQRPGWRYDAAVRPSVYGLERFCSRLQDHASGLRRLIPRGLQARANDLRSASLDRLAATLPRPLAARLQQIWGRRRRRLTRRIPRVVIPGTTQYRNLVIWHAGRLGGINDAWLVRLIRHLAGLDGDPAVAQALRLYLDPDQLQMRRFIGMMVFSGEPDRKIAKDWGLPVQVITAMRMLFFDFGALPKAKVPRWAMMTQMVNNGDIAQDDFQLYRRAEDLGPLGLKAQVAGASLNEEERDTVRDFIGKTAVTNAFNLQFAARTPKDALAYSKALGDLAKVEHLREEAKLTALNAKKLAQSIQTDATVGLAREDEALLTASLEALSREDGNPRYRTLAELVRPEKPKGSKS